MPPLYLSYRPRPPLLTHSLCKLVTVIGVITERANATGFNPVHHVAKAGRNVTTPTGPETEQSDRTSSVGLRGVFSKRRIETSLWQPSWLGSGRSGHKAAMMTLRTPCLSIRGQTTALADEVMSQHKSLYCRQVPPANDNIWVPQAECSSQIL